ncbi:MAG: helix-turn-helix domain-containing protein [Desulfofustis sp.]|nr:helix-turn-helix domain-containing protein [Desulfofustis sp.]
MKTTNTEKRRVSSGISDLDRLLGDLFIGDNVLWYEEAGSFSSAFCLSFITETVQARKPLIYVTFDRSPKNLVSYLGPLAESQNLTILDCFTNGKGDRSDIFNKFYEKDGALWPYQVIKVNEPSNAGQVAEAMYGLHTTLHGDVHFIVDSLTGMQALWGEEVVLDFYVRTCPRLYELDTIAYWLIEKGAHSGKLKANINKVAQVVIDLAVRRGNSSLKIIKAEKRHCKHLNEHHAFLAEETGIVFESQKPPAGTFDLGARIKEIRQKQGLSQKQLAELTGVTPSTISQVEKNLIYPSLPALFRMAESLSVDTAALFKESGSDRGAQVFPAADRSPISIPRFSRELIEAERLLPPDSDLPAEIILVRILPGKKLSGHFSARKGKEFGYLVRGSLEMKINGRTETLLPGDTVLLPKDTPERWHNQAADHAAEVLWVIFP